MVLFEDLFAEEDKQLRERNQRVVEWVENPATIRRDVWPEALKLAERAGPDTLFKNLIALSRSGIGLKQGRGKLATEAQL